MIQPRRLEKIKKVASQRQAGLVVVLEDIHDRHNVQAIFRSCDAFGVQRAAIIFENPDKYNKKYNPKKVGRSSSSAGKWMDFDIYDSASKCIKALKKQGYEIWATILNEDAKSIYSSKFTNKKIALLIGNEHAGLSETAIKLADKKVYIPMRGMVQSFNVSVSAAIFLHEITRQRHKKMDSFLLNKKEQTTLVKDFTQR